MTSRKCRHNIRCRRHVQVCRRNRCRAAESIMHLNADQVSGRTRGARALEQTKRVDVTGESSRWPGKIRFAMVAQIQPSNTDDDQP